MALRAGRVGVAPDQVDGQGKIIGGGTIKPSSILYGKSLPSADLGNNGDLFLLLTDDLVPVIKSENANIIAGQNLSTAFRAFDDDNTTYWSTSDYNYNNMYIGYDFGTGKSVIVNQVKIMPRSWNNVVQLHTFKVQGSNDLTEWVDLYEGEIPNDTEYAGVWNAFQFSNTNAYRAYRLLALDLNTSQTFTIFGLQFAGPEDVVSDPLCKVEDAWQPLEGTFLKDVNTGSKNTILHLSIKEVI